jgi:hypothetical protein
LAPIRLRDDGVLDLQRVDGLLDVRRRTLDLDLVSDRDAAVRQADRRDADVPVVMEHFPDLLPLHRIADRREAIKVLRAGISRAARGGLPGGKS